MVGPIQEVNNVHPLDIERQEVGWNVLGELTGTAADLAEQDSAPSLATT